jgi:hypothetical protein
MKKAHLIWLFAMTLSMAGNSVAQTAAAPSGLYKRHACPGDPGAYPVPSSMTQFTLAISAADSTVKAGAKVVIQIALTNTSDKVMGERPDVRDQGFMVDVTVVGNGAAPDTEGGRQWKHDCGWREEMSGGILELNPGETRKRSLAISDLYDLTRPGQYTVQVHRYTVKSNTITVTVTP